ncbi:U1 small nuclear ribonucleoprotein C-like [Amphibalanus amphitrite]|uniref:U1 small nuclear ribonucleoprotein C-like n=1 Tax=Amphibalanus amphitrite TaxID=1232801 RepID=UPI001C8FB2FA|nr:U1 small nuclear ribonucleoprotein C-like [Amphibalanus amphitrite]
MSIPARAAQSPSLQTAAMPKYFCDYCDTYLTHDSPSVRKTHCSGRKHKENVKIYYQKWMEEQAQSLIDATTAAFKAGKIQNNPFAAGKGPVAGREGGAAIPPPANMGGAPRAADRPPLSGVGGRCAGRWTLRWTPQWNSLCDVLWMS